MGNSDNSAPPRGTVALETAASLWQAFLQDAMRGKPIAKFDDKPKGVSQVAVDANSGMLPGPFTRRTFKEWFATGTAPKQVDNTKVGVAIDGATSSLWQDGCLGPRRWSARLDLSGVDAGHAAWQKADRGWIARAMHGPGRRRRPQGHQDRLLRLRQLLPVRGDLGCVVRPDEDLSDRRSVAQPVPERKPAAVDRAAPGAVARCDGSLWPEASR